MSNHVEKLNAARKATVSGIIQLAARQAELLEVRANRSATSEQHMDAARKFRDAEALVASLVQEEVACVIKAVEAKQQVVEETL